MTATSLTSLSPKLRDSAPRTAEALTALGQVLTDRRRPGEAESLLQEALAIREAKLDSSDPRTLGGAAGRWMPGAARFSPAPAGSRRDGKR